jgi:hypothetical protein
MFIPGRNPKSQKSRKIQPPLILIIMASDESINILIVVDTDAVKAAYPNPSTDSTSPTGISHENQYMIAADPRGIVSGQGTGNLNFNANVGDSVHFRGTSIYQNSDDAIIIYNIVKYSGDEVFNTFVTNKVTRAGAVQPDPSELDGIPPLEVSQNFMSLDSTVSNAGTEGFKVYFGLYTLEDDGETQTLFGYYSWDPQITVQ